MTQTRSARTNWVAPLNAALLQKFVDLATRLSPDGASLTLAPHCVRCSAGVRCPLCGQRAIVAPSWLTCDGELSRREVNRRYSKLQRQWRALERKAGRAVTEDEVWAWEDTQRQPREVPPDAHLEEDYELRVSGGGEVDE